MSRFALLVANTSIDTATDTLALLNPYAVFSSFTGNVYQTSEATPAGRRTVVLK